MHIQWLLSASNGAGYRLSSSFSGFRCLQKKPVVALTPKMFVEGLSLLCKTGDGLAHAFVRFDAVNRYNAMHCHSLSVCLSVCLFVRSRISKLTPPNFTKLSAHFIMAVADRSPCDGNAIIYVLPVLWMTSLRQEICISPCSECNTYL